MSEQLVVGNVVMLKKQCEDSDNHVVKFTQSQRDNIIRSVLNTIYLLGIQEEIYRHLK